jgi:hypothetical protein
VPAAAPVAPAAAPVRVVPGGTPVEIRRIGQWSTSGVTSPARLIIRDDAAYAQFWASLGPAAGARPSVDFTRDIVVAVAAGQQSTGGHTIAIQQARQVGSGLAIDVLETAPPPGCATTQALTQPVDVVVVEAASVATWSFSDHRATGGC